MPTTPATTHMETKSTNENRGTTLKDVRDDVRTLKSDITDYASHAAGHGIEAVKHGAEAAIDTSKRVADKAVKAHEGMCEHVRAHPTTSILIAFGVGALAARLLPRR